MFTVDMFTVDMFTVDMFQEDSAVFGENLSGCIWMFVRSVV